MFTSGFERDYTVGEGVGSLEVCVAILDPQEFELSGNAQINYTFTLEPETAAGTLGNCWYVHTVQGLKIM